MRENRSNGSTDLGAGSRVIERQSVWYDILDTDNIRFPFISVYIDFGVNVHLKSMFHSDGFVILTDVSRLFPTC